VHSRIEIQEGLKPGRPIGIKKKSILAPKIVSYDVYNKKNFRNECGSLKI
jgi:hypothetical protein